MGPWPAPDEDRAFVGAVSAVSAGAALSVVGMALRWAAHIVQNRKIAEDD